MIPEDTALALIWPALNAPGTVTDTAPIEAAMVLEDPQQRHLDTTKSLARFCAGLLYLMDGNNPEVALNILGWIEAAYKAQGKSDV